MINHALLKHHLPFISLMLLMALTRFHHFGSTLLLPDASLAVFFLIGLVMVSPWFFAICLVEAGMIDFLAISQFAVNDYCISPAYLFLIPTYAIMWFAGKQGKALIGLSFHQSWKMFGLMTTATTLAFAVSNLSFFAFSGRFEAMPLSNYVDQTWQYYLPYLSATLIYVCIALGIIKLIRLTPYQQSHKPTASDV
jgi:hypothetical protein